MTFRWTMLGDDAWQATIANVTMQIWTPDEGTTFRWAIKDRSESFGGEATSFPEAAGVCERWLRLNHPAVV